MARDKEIKTISLYQPWATLLATGAKRYETRSWSTSHRGPMAIHAGKHWTPRTAAQCKEEPFASLLWSKGFYLDTVAPDPDLPLGCIVAVGNLISCRPTEDLLREIGHQERAFGDFSHGRYAWEYDGVIPLLKPIPYRGMQGIFTVPAELIERALAEQSVCR